MLMKEHKASMPATILNGAVHLAELSTRWIKYDVLVLACYPNWAHRHNII